MNFNVIKAYYIKDYQIELTFQDGSTGIADHTWYVNNGEVFNQFRDAEYFKNFKVEFGTLVWGNGEIDIAPETLYIKATGKPFVLMEEELELHHY